MTGFYYAIGIVAAIVVGILMIRWLVQWSRFMSLADRRVLITGGSRGLGFELARQLGKQNARVAICARNEEELQHASEKLALEGCKVVTVRADLSNAADTRHMLAEVREQLGRIDVLINNAGQIQVGPMQNMSVRDYESVMAINYWGAVRCALDVLPEMMERGEGRIVNISSVGGKVAVPHLLPYDASKFALVGFSEGLRAEAISSGVYVTTVCPGLMRTGSAPFAEFRGDRSAEYTWFRFASMMPVMTMSAERAASKIIKAMQVGKSTTVLGWNAKLLVLMHDLFPGFTSFTLSVANRLLPKPVTNVPVDPKLMSARRAPR